MESGCSRPWNFIKSIRLLLVTFATYCIYMIPDMVERPSSDCTHSITHTNIHTHYFLSNHSIPNESSVFAKIKLISAQVEVKMSLETGRKWKRICSTT